MLSSPHLYMRGLRWPVSPLSTRTEPWPRPAGPQSLAPLDQSDRCHCWFWPIGSVGITQWYKTTVSTTPQNNSCLSKTTSLLQVNKQRKRGERETCANLHLLSLYAGQSLGHQLLVDPTEVGHLLLAFMMDVHTALWREQGESVVHAMIHTIAALATGLCFTRCYVIIHIQWFTFMLTFTLYFTVRSCIM